MPRARNSPAQARRQSATLTALAAAVVMVCRVLKLVVTRLLTGLLRGFLCILRGKLRRLIFRDQSVDNFAKRFAFENLRQLVKRQVDPVIGNPPLRIVVGADALGPIPGPDLAAPLGGARRILLLPLEVVEPRPQHGERLG